MSTKIFLDFCLGNPKDTPSLLLEYNMLAKVKLLFSNPKQFFKKSVDKILKYYGYQNIPIEKQQNLAKTDCGLPVDLSAHQIGFMHIGKTAGTSFHHLLISLLSPIKYLRVSPEMMDSFENELEDYELVLGHFSFYQTNKFRKSPYLITFLRDPVDRVLSSYYFLKSWTGLIDDTNREAVMAGKNLSLEDFVESKLRGVRAVVENHQTRFLAGDWRNPDIIEPDSCLNVAIENLKQFRFVGLTEQYNESVAMLCRNLGIKLMPKIEKRNVTPERPNLYEVSQEIKLRILNKNQLDMTVYTEACRIFDFQRLQQTKALV